MVTAALAAAGAGIAVACLRAGWPAAAERVLAATALATLAAGALLARRLGRAFMPAVDALLQATRAIAAGDLRFSTRVDDRSELGELAANFDRMTDSLRAGYDALRAEVRERRAAEDALRRSEERYALAARAANDGLWDWDLGAGRLYLSERWKSMLGHAEGDVGDAPAEWLDRVHLEDQGRLEAEIEAHLRGDTPHLATEYRIRHADGSFLWVLCRGIAVRDAQGRATRMAGSQTDVTARKQAEERLLHDAFHDALTGLPNRALFLDRLEQLLRNQQRHPEQAYAVLFLDLDRFKVVNDSLGHGVGDQLLVAVADRLSKAVRPNDTVARLGGDEFAILLHDVRGADAVQVAERVSGELRRAFVVEGNEIFTRASIGIAPSSDRYEQAEQVVRDADIAMYQAKSRERGFELFDADMHGGVVDRLALESDLRRAVEHGEDFLLHYQPIVDVRASRVVGFEALARWRHPQRGLVPPAEFIPLAEESGIILPLGDWIVRNACRELRAWGERRPWLGPLTISVNISARQFRQPDVVERLARVFRETGVDPRQVALEVTESAIMDDVEETAAKLARLREMGAAIHVDDFGTGYSSLSYLHRFPITAVKIDRTFVQGLNGNAESEEVVRAIVSMAQALDFEVIAEGVESPEQLARVRALGCRSAQGFLLGVPAPAEEAFASHAGACAGVAPPQAAASA
jgi:diguanylate cyclase (GGDEF)-like protein/PAS domain S-box-containing protein